jgi:uncharacterized protein (TIGR02145 family)
MLILLHDIAIFLYKHDVRLYINLILSFMKKISNIPVVLMLILSLQVNAQISLSLKVFLQGPYIGTAMNAALNAQNLIPLNQPYNVSPWNYTGAEQVASIPNADVVDWALVELRETTGDAFTATQDKMINRQAAFIKADGNIVGTDGSSLIIYNGAITSNLYVVIWHRNHLAVMSSGALTNNGGVYSWDFTDQLGKAHLDGQKLIGTNVFGMAGGDSDANGIVGQDDKDANWTPDAGEKGYKPGDLNLDAQVNNRDKDDSWKPNIGKTTKVPFYIPFVCGNDFIDSRDGQTYSSVLIGTQCWMADNLNIGTMILNSTNMSNNSILEKFCYDNNAANCAVYGGLYQWHEMMQYTAGTQGICPANWHIPVEGEWVDLINGLGGNVVAGGKMKTTGTIEAGTGLWHTPNTGATNSSGFSGLPGGWYSSDAGNFVNKGNNAFFWSTLEYWGFAAFYRSLQYDSEIANTSYSYYSYGLSVRCIKSNEPPSSPSSPQPSNGAINQPINTTLSWSCNDPENDPLTYDVYFGTSNPPALVVSGQTNATYNPGALNYSTPYFWKIVAHDDKGNTTIGSVWSFTAENFVWSCGDTIIDARDNQIYNTVQIGTQCWMAENLNFGTIIQGNTEQGNNLIPEKYCYNNNPANCDVYGGLYQWLELTNYWNPGDLCPAGWYLPWDTEWDVLINQLGGSAVAGGKLKSTGTIEAGTGLWLAPNTGATNESGFNAISTGYYENGTFLGMGTHSQWWTGRDLWTWYAFYYEVAYNNDDIIFNYIPQSYGFSARCVKE